MRRFLTAPLITLAILAGTMGVHVPAAQAELPATTPTQEELDARYFTDAAITAQQDQQADAAARAAREAVDATDPNSVFAPKTIGPEPNKTVTEPKETKDEAFGYVATKIMTLFAWLLGVAIITLDYAVYYTVVTMGDFVKDLSAVGITWRILRDIGNIMLIFGFLAIGITTILNVDWYGGGKKLLPSLLIAAVFLNFSLFITEAVIDTGNLFATQFYTQIKGGSIPSNPSVSQEAIETEGISNKIMGQLGFQTIYTAGRVNTKVFEAGNTWLIGFMGILLFMTAAFVMFSLAFILIARFVILIFLIILAPIGFAGLAVPKLSSIASKWWTTLFDQTITAPVLLLMLYIALAIITDVSFLSGICSSSSGTTCSKDWTGFVNNNDLSGFSSMLLSFLVAMGLLLAVTIFAKQLSAFGASTAIKFGAALSLGATAYGASTLFGGSAFLARKGLQRVAPNSRVVRAVSNYALRPLERAKFDIRSVGGGAALTAVGLGEASKSVGGSTVNRAKQGIETVRHLGEEANRQYDQETRLPRLRRAISTQNHQEIGRIIGNMSEKELESSSIQHLIEHSPMAIAALPQNRFDKLLTSDALNDAQKNNLRTQRQAGFIARYTDAAEYRNPPNHAHAPNAPIPSVRHPGTNMSRGEQAVRALTNEAASQIPDDVLVNPNVHENLSIRQLNAIYNAGRIGDATAVTVGNFLRTDPAFIAYFAGRNPQQQADLRAFWHV